MKLDALLICISALRNLAITSQLRKKLRKSIELVQNISESPSPD